MQRAKVFVAKAKIHVEIGGQLPGILPEEIEGVHNNESLWITHRYGRLHNIAGHIVGQCLGSGIERRVCTPWPLSSIELKLSSTTPVIELIHVRLTDFSPESELVPASDIGNNVR